MKCYIYYVVPKVHDIMDQLYFGLVMIRMYELYSFSLYLLSRSLIPVFCLIF